MSIQPEGIGIDQAVDAIRPIISQRLREVEQKHALRVLFACESGSRAWGFASTDSDFDVRFVYVRPAAAYLKLSPPADAFDIHSDNDLDLAGWDIRKAAELMRKSNSPLLEWLDSPIIYERDEMISARLIELRDIYFDAKKSVYHYLSLGGGVWNKYLKDNPEPVRKKYLYTLRPMACVRYIEQHGCQPPTRFESVLDMIQIADEVRGAIDLLVADKKVNHELGVGQPDQILNNWIAESLTHGERVAESLPPSNVDNQALDQLIADAILGTRQTNGA